jgi:catechol 2,3-dioxygenase-like lactoylglutathione lyase family enzyme
MKKDLLVRGYRHTGIICKNLKKSLFFYNKLLGMKIQQDFWDNSQYINTISGLKEANIHMIKLKMHNGDILELLHYPTHPTTLFNLPTYNVGLAHIALEVSDINKIYKKLKRNKVRFLSKPTVSSEKFAKVCYCFDPSNVRVELVEILY